MDKTVIVRNLKIGDGRTKICVPIVGKTQDAVLDAARAVPEDVADLVEWRADYFDGVFSNRELEQTIGLLRDVLGEKPLLFTFRTAEEGGEKEIQEKEYASLLQFVAETGFADLIDAEVFRGCRNQMNSAFFQEIISGKQRLPMEEVIRTLGEHAGVIGSYHDFQKTPSAEEMIGRLQLMAAAGVSIPKLAVMPHSREDVLRLMDATLQADREITDRPLIAMSMGALGAVTRVAGRNFGSAVTFGCVGTASAPGQMEACKVKQMMELLY
ncbi:MAG: type I 3-dehydroquinate dehydratase [Clostridiaceae bacterium]|nr:type I 3-dehydroquinate dehydratase [Clostridiaceae bacterium]